ncbi:MAG: hypothetical protein RIC55_22990 [Pirellulaceae bacterium]
MSRLRNPVRRRHRRGGAVELEAVLITAVTFPLAVALYYLAMRGFTYLYEMIAALVGWPYL